VRSDLRVVMVGIVPVIAQTSPPAERLHAGGRVSLPYLSAPRRIYYGRVCGWRAKHAVSLGHLDFDSLVVGVRAEAEVPASPRLARALAPGSLRDASQTRLEAVRRLVELGLKVKGK
jgi:hypothetical protein